MTTTYSRKSHILPLESAGSSGFGKHKARIFLNTFPELPYSAGSFRASCMSARTTLPTRACAAASLTRNQPFSCWLGCCSTPDEALTAWGSRTK